MTANQLLSKAFIESHPEYGNISGIYEKYEINSLDLENGVVWFNAIYKPINPISHVILASS